MSSYRFYKVVDKDGLTMDKTVYRRDAETMAITLAEKTGDRFYVKDVKGTVLYSTTQKKTDFLSEKILMLKKTASTRHEFLNKWEWIGYQNAIEDVVDYIKNLNK